MSNLSLVLKVIFLGGPLESQSIPALNVDQFGPRVMSVGINSLCDVQASDVNCTFIDVYGERFPLIKGLCSLENLSTKELQTTSYLPISPNHVRCEIAKSWLERINFHEQELLLKINIQNEKNFDNQINIGGANAIIFDSECKVCEEKRNSRGNHECVKKVGVCFYKRKCFKEGDKSPEDKCSVCRQGNWINEKSKFEQKKV